MILILTIFFVFVTLSVVTIPPLASHLYFDQILTLNHADVIGDQSDAVIQNAWFRLRESAVGRVIQHMTVTCTKSYNMADIVRHHQ